MKKRHFMVPVILSMVAVYGCGKDDNDAAKEKQDSTDNVAEINCKANTKFCDGNIARICDDSGHDYEISLKYDSTAENVIFSSEEDCFYGCQNGFCQLKDKTGLQPGDACSDDANYICSNNTMLQCGENKLRVVYWDQKGLNKPLSCAEVEEGQNMTCKTKNGIGQCYYTCHFQDATGADATTELPYEGTISCPE